MSTVCKILVGDCQRKKPHGRIKRRKEDNIKMNLKVTERKKLHWIPEASVMSNIKTKRRT